MTLRNSWSAPAACALLLLASCASEPPVPQAHTPDTPRAVINQALPLSLSDRSGWQADLYAGFTVLGIAATRDNVCAVIAVIEQESSFQIDPPVPRLPAIAWRAIDTRAARAGVPRMIVRTALDLTSRTGRTYAARIDGVKTEKQLSDIFEDFIGAVPMGRTMFSGLNPIRTRGPMQVNITFAEAYAKARPYPYPIKDSIEDEVFTRRGSLYFGIAHLLDYQAPYDRFLFRFADFNAGQYASRNAAFQNAVAIASGITILTDGALLPHGADAPGAGSTEAALRTLAGRLGMTPGDIHDTLEQGKTQAFERTTLYTRVFALAERLHGRRLPRAQVPTIRLQGPKLAHPLSTDWYAHRVEGRFTRCLRG